MYSATPSVAAAGSGDGSSAPFTVASGVGPVVEIRMTSGSSIAQMRPANRTTLRTTNATTPGVRRARRHRLAASGPSSLAIGGGNSASAASTGSARTSAPAGSGCRRRRPRCRPPCDARRELERAVVAALLAPDGQHLAGRAQLDGSVTLGVGEVDRAIAVDREVRFVDQRFTLPARNGPLSDRATVRVEFLHAVVPRVGHVEVPAFVDGDADRLAELTRIGAAPAVDAHRLAIGVEPQHAVVARVGHEERAGRVDGDAARAEEVRGGVGRVADHLLLAPLGLEFPVLVEAMDAVVPRVRDVDVAVRADRDAPRLLELPIALALGAPGEHEL